MRISFSSCFSGGGDRNLRFASRTGELNTRIQQVCVCMGDSCRFPAVWVEWGGGGRSRKGTKGFFSFFFSHPPALPRTKMVDFEGGRLEEAGQIPGAPPAQLGENVWQ